MKIAEARQIAKKWQEILRLKDWRIHIRWRKPSDTKDYDMQPNIAGCVDWFTEQGIITIILRRDANEHVILHELIHCRIESHREKPEDYSEQYEFGINVLTDVIMGEPELRDGDLG